MSNSFDSCCSPCPTVQTVNIPGIAGPAGGGGAPGQDGTNAFAIVQSPGFTVPTVGNDVLVPLSSTLWMSVGEIVIAGTGFGGPVTGPAHFRVISINSSTTATIRALAYPNDVVNPATIAASALLTPAGLIGPTGTSGSTFPTTTKGDTMFDDGANSPSPHVIRLAIGVQGQARYADPNATPGSVISWKGSTWSTATILGTSNQTGNDTTEDNLISFNVPANTLRNGGDILEWEAVFDIGIAAVTKQIKIYLGGLSGSVLHQFAAFNQAGGSIIFRGTVMRINANSQLAWATYYTTDGSAVSTTANSRTSPNQDLGAGGGLLFLCTGKNGSNSPAAIVQQALTLNYRAAA